MGEMDSHRLLTFCDAAGKPDQGGWCVVAGFLSTEGAWDHFETSWKTFLRSYELPFLQMSSLHARKPPYNGAKWNTAEYMIEFLQTGGLIVRSHIKKWAADVVSFADFEKATLVEPGLRHYTNAYGLCATAISLRLQMEYVLGALPNKADIQHCFEEGDKGVKHIEAVFARCGMRRPLVLPGKQSLLHDRQHWVQFQAADWLAFETRLIAKRYAPSKPIIRPSLRELLKGTPGEVKLWTYEDLLEFCRRKRIKGEIS